ncbi:hypothetical protein QBC43DRAFT_223424, partial [Cladorrhinum sp. PSN259]
KKLRTMFHSSKNPIIVFTDYSATKGIVENSNLNTGSTDRDNKRLRSAACYLSGYNLKVYHIPGKKNYVPDALSRLRALKDGPNKQSGERVLDDIWLAYAEAQMDPELKEAFVEGYTTDNKYSVIINNLKLSKSTTEDGGTFSRPGYPFIISEGLLYNIRADGSRSYGKATQRWMEKDDEYRCCGRKKSHNMRTTY